MAHDALGRVGRVELVAWHRLAESVAPRAYRRARAVRPALGRSHELTARGLAANPDGGARVGARAFHRLRELLAAHRPVDDVTRCVVACGDSATAPLQKPAHIVLVTAARVLAREAAQLAGLLVDHRRGDGLAKHGRRRRRVRRLGWGHRLEGGGRHRPRRRRGGRGRRGIIAT